MKTFKQKFFLETLHSSIVSLHGNDTWSVRNKKSLGKYFALSISFFFILTSFASATVVPCGMASQVDTVNENCTLNHISVLFGNTMKISFEVVAVFAVAMIAYVGFRFLVGKNKSAELTDSKERVWKLGTGIVMFFGGMSLIVMILNSIGLNSQFLDMFKFFFPTALLDAFSAHAYAATTAPVDPTLLPAPLNLSNPLDFFALLLRLTIRWLVFPCIILSWLYAGLLYVKAQGNPTEIKDAHSWLWWTFIGTGIIMLAETFYAVLRGTITNIIS